MKTDICSLSIGMKLEIEIFKGSNGIVYPSQLLDIKDCDEFTISGPIVKNELVLLHVGDDINISYMIKDKGKHYFLAKIISRSHTGIYSLKVKKISNIKNIQQRKYYRLPTNIPILKHFKEDNEKTENNVESCETKDISGGGIKIYSNKLHKSGDRVACALDLLDEKIFIKCKVIRIEEVDSFNYKYLIGLEFVDIEDRDIDIIIKYIFNEQRKLRLKGLI